MYVALSRYAFHASDLFNIVFEWRRKFSILNLNFNLTYAPSSQ